MRESEGDPSVVSLRDVKRVLVLLEWFIVKILPKGESSGASAAAAAGTSRGGARVAGPGAEEQGKGQQKVSVLGRATILALAHVYCYRLPTAQLRHSYWCIISAVVKAEGGWMDGWVDGWMGG